MINKKINQRENLLQNVTIVLHTYTPRRLTIFTAKDLSHVPCKFFRVGSCTAGASCPFSHSSPSTAANGQSTKDTCAWFIKGNCKFGHKCALAHVLPGQSMAMDRKNKKAAQAAAGATQGGKNSTKGRSKYQPSSGVNTSSNPLLSGGSTAPTRVVPSRMPNLKATISPSAPAPPLKDTDFATMSFGMHDTDKLPSAPALPPQQPDIEKEVLKDLPSVVKPPSPTSPLPLSTPSAPRRTPADFGPIGSPPRSSPHARLNGFSPGASPGGIGFLREGTSPFSAPGTQSTFFPGGTPSTPPATAAAGQSEFKQRSGLAASLGVTRGGWTDFGPVPSQVLSHNTAVLEDEDQDLEEFIPGSLSDLLTPSERSRRMSRTNTTQTRPVLSAQHSHSGLLNPATNESRHHYSRSVPAPSLLGDIKSIWSDNPHPSPSQNHSALGSTGVGTPSSFKSTTTSNFGGRSLDLRAEDNHLSPSNASAAFLPGLHHHYLNRGGGTGGMGMQRSVSGGERAALQAHANFSGQQQQQGQGIGLGLNGNGMSSTAFSPPRMNVFGSRPPFVAHDSLSQITQTPQSQSQLHAQLQAQSQSSSHLQDQYYNRAQPILSEPHHQQHNPISPSARALQAHAPGQSLPQGLAAGYSRIHALPPPPNLPSPAFSGIGSPGSGNGSGIGSPGTNQNMEWLGLGKAPEQQQQGLAPSTSGPGGSTGLESMFSRLSYSAAAAASSRPAQPSNLSASSTNVNPNPTPTPAAVSRNPSGGKPWQGTGGPLSPLSGPVVTGDDDDLFSMDG